MANAWRTSRWWRWTLAGMLVAVLLFGYPDMPRREPWGDFSWGTRDGYLGVVIWSDRYKYGAMLYRETDTGWQVHENGVKTRTYRVTWWLRFEWMRRP